MDKYQHTTLLIPKDERDKLEILARELGYFQTRGAGAGTLGSISALMCAIARKEVITMKGKSMDDMSLHGKNDHPSDV